MRLVRYFDIGKLSRDIELGLRHGYNDIESDFGFCHGAHIIVEKNGRIRLSKCTKVTLFKGATRYQDVNSYLHTEDLVLRYNHMFHISNRKECRVIILSRDTAGEVRDLIMELLDEYSYEK